MFIPTADSVPIPLEYLDVMRYTRTDIDGIEAEIRDVWFGNDQGDRKLSEPWVGRTHLYLITPKPRNGYAWQWGKLNGARKVTTRPDFIFPEVWSSMNKEDRRIAQRVWEDLKPAVKRAKTIRNLWHIKPNQVHAYDSLID